MRLAGAVMLAAIAGWSLSACSSGRSAAHEAPTAGPRISPAATPSPQPTAPASDVSNASPPAARVILAHRPVQQRFSASCEAAAAALALEMAGYPATEAQVIAALPTDPRPPVLSGRSVVRWGNPWEAFVGNQDGWWPWAHYDPHHPTGYGVYAPPLLTALHRLGAPRAHGGTGMTLAALRAAVRSGHPAVVWLPSRHDFERVGDALATGSWTAWDGSAVTYAVHEHTQTLLGADDNGFYAGTPDYQWTPGYPFLSYWTDAEFARAFAFLNNMAIIVQ